MNPYIRLLYAALQHHGVSRSERLEVDFPFRRELLERDIDVIHIHCPEGLWQYRGRTIPWRLRTLGSAGYLLQLWRFLGRAKKRGIRIVWTVHNLRPHEMDTTVDRVGSRVLAAMADLLVCHSEWSRDQVCQQWGIDAERTLVMYHGNYDGIYAAKRSRAEVLCELGLEPGRHTLLCVGALREYKGFDQAIAAMDLLGSEYQLIVAGQALSRALERQLVELADNRPNVRVIAQRLTDGAMADLLNAADCVVLPYKRITGSGALLAALTVGRGIVCTDLPYFREVLAPRPEAAVLFAPGGAAPLSAAINEFFDMPLERRMSAARELAGLFDWLRVTEPLARWLRAHARGRRPR